MYLNSIPLQTVWKTIVQSIEKRIIIITQVAKHAKYNEEILKTTARFKNLRHVFHSLTEKKYLEITYTKVTCLKYAQHLTPYIVNCLCGTPK